MDLSRLRNIPGADEILAASPDVIQNPTAYRGSWRTEVFRNDHPLHLEIGMGKGKFLSSLALKNPQVNYVGMELYASVLVKAVRRLTRLREAAAGTGSGEKNDAPADPFANLRMICKDARAVPEIFAPGEVDRIYLNFSDPWPKTRHANRRLTSAPFLARYEQILSAGGQIEFKTDNRDLFAFSLQQVDAARAWETALVIYDLHQDPALSAENVLTEYEEKYADHPICKMIIRRKRSVDPGTGPDMDRSCNET